jgi:hypothetical protein
MQGWHLVLAPLLRRVRSSVALTAVSLGWLSGASALRAQQEPKPAASRSRAVSPSAAGTYLDPDAEIVGDRPAKPKSEAEMKEEAWTILTNSIQSKSSETRTQGLGALAQLGDTARSIDLIASQMKDKDVDVRTAAAVAAGQTKSPRLATALRDMLDDKEPQAAFGAALALWKLGDRSGEDILMAVVDGGRPTAPGAMEGAMHEASKDLHSPATLAKMGAEQGVSMLLGPFGMGITAYNYLHKNGGDSSRVEAVEAIAQNHTTPIRNELVGALADKDPGVRAAAAKALSRYQDQGVAVAMMKLFYDEKPPVRFTGAAAYLICTGDAVGLPDANAKKPVAARRKRKAMQEGSR